MQGFPFSASKTSRSRSVVSLGCWLAAASLLLPSLGFARVNFKPKWSQNPANSSSVQNDNASFMADFTIDNNAAERREFEASLMDPGRARELRQQYEDLERRKDLQHNYGLSAISVSDLPESQLNDRRELSKQVVSTVGRYQGMQKLRAARIAAERDPNIQVLKKPIAVVAGAYALYTGQSFNFPITDSTHFYGRAALRDQAGEMRVESPIVTARAEMQNKVDPTPTPTPVIDGNPERYKISLSRAIPALDISSGLAYGTTTRSVSASVTKPIMNHLTCTFDTFRPVGGSDYTDNRIRFNYGMSF